LLREECSLQVKKALEMDPSFTQKKWRDLTFYSDASIVEGEIADLAKVGLPQ
jgi:hypothetical protein